MTWPPRPMPCVYWMCEVRELTEFIASHTQELTMKQAFPLANGNGNASSSKASETWPQYKYKTAHLAHSFHPTLVAWEQLTMETTHGDSLSNHPNYRPQKQSRWTQVTDGWTTNGPHENWWKDKQTNKQIQHHSAIKEIRLVQNQNNSNLH